MIDTESAAALAEECRLACGVAAALGRVKSEDLLRLLSLPSYSAVAKLLAKRNGHVDGLLRHPVIVLFTHRLLQLSGDAGLGDLEAERTWCREVWDGKRLPDSELPTRPVVIP